MSVEIKRRRRGGKGKTSWMLIFLFVSQQKKKNVTTRFYISDAFEKYEKVTQRVS